ncbi:MAG: kynurenine formamidase [Acidimicrobiales bacterium]|jgi:kynurenine formamidase
MVSSPDLPDFDDLPVLEGLGLRHAWGVFGPDDVLGSMNMVTPERVAAAAALVSTGERVSLDLPLNLPSPPLFGRQAYEHHIFPLNRNEMDDRLDNFHPQGSTQWDALNHVRCREHGFWGGRTDNPTDGPMGLGIEQFAEHGIAGRGVLVNVAGWMSTQGDYDALHPRAITVADVEATLEWQRVELQPGDLLCIRFGWEAAYRALDQEARVAYAEGPTFAGLIGSEDMARFLWNNHPASICCDNPAVEVVPGDPEVGSLHRRLLPTLGFALGEMFAFEELAQTCARLDRSTFFFVAAPMKVPGALGSPGNAVAIF